MKNTNKDQVTLTLTVNDAREVRFALRDRLVYLIKERDAAANRKSPNYASYVGQRIDSLEQIINSLGIAY